MSESAPGIIQYIDQHERDLQTGVAADSTKAGHPVTPAEVKPVDDSNLEVIGDILGKTAVHMVNSAGSEGLSTGVETASSKKGLSLLRQRIGRLFIKNSVTVKSP